MAEPVCPYCRMPFDEASPPRIFCTACGMPHHEDCYQENGGCTVFGCKCAPADDPKLQVSQSDLSAVSVPVQPYAPVAQQYAPMAQQTVPVAQQPAPVQGYQPSRYSGPLGLSQAAATAPAQAPTAAPNPLHVSVGGIPLCCAGLCFHTQEPDKLHCSWHFSWRAGHTQFLCRIHRPRCGSAVPYRFDAGLSRHRVVDLGHHRNLYRGKGQHRSAF